MQFTHTYINIYKVHYTRMARTFATAMERNLDPNPPARCFLSVSRDESVTASETKTALAQTVVQISLQLAGHQLVRLPLFLSARELLFLAKNFPPVQGINCSRALAGIFTGKHQQLKSTLSEIGW